MPQNNGNQSPQMRGQGGPGRGPGRGGHGPGGAAGGKIHIEKDTGKQLKRLFSYFNRHYMIMFFIAMGCMAMNAYVSVRSSLFLGTLIDVDIANIIGMDEPDFSGLVVTLSSIAVIFGAGIITSFSQNIIMARIARGILRDIRTDLFAAMQKLPVSFFDNNSFGDVMSRFTNDVSSMQQVLNNSIPQVISSLLTIVSVFTAMVKLSPGLTAVELVTVFIMYKVTITLGGISAKNFRLRQAVIGDVNGYTEEMINGQKVIKVFCHEDETIAEFDEKSENLRKVTTKANIYSSILGPIMGNLGNIQYVIIAVAGGYFAITGKISMSLGTIASFLSLSRSFSHPVNQISQQINSVVMALAGAQRVFDMMDLPSEADEGSIVLVNASEDSYGVLCQCEEHTGIWAWKETKADGSFELTRLRGDVRFKDVDFGYVPDHQILYDINLFAKPGQKIAFVGSTGAGKTTITNLINRFYDITDGTITYDGIDIKKIRKDDLRRSLGMVLQDVNLFTGTIMDNIRYGRLDATDEEVMAAARLANADSFISKLPDGYNTVISGTGSQLSQGQCQLLSIARCAVADPPVMILDEATSSIDTRTEALIQAGMDRLMEGRTVFVIAHRLSTVQNSNAIMVIEKGHIIERGDHDDLIEQKGRYYQLYTGKTA